MGNGMVTPSSARPLTILLLTVTISLGLATAFVSQGAADPSYGLNTTADAALLKPRGTATAQEQVNRTIGTILQTILGLTGVVFLIVLITAGDLWMTADGNEEKLTKARGMLFNAAVGLIITFAAYVSTALVIQVVLDASGA